MNAPRPLAAIVGQRTFMRRFGKRAWKVLSKMGQVLSNVRERAQQKAGYTGYKRAVGFVCSVCSFTPNVRRDGSASIELRRFDEAAVIAKKARRSYSASYRYLASAFAHLGCDAEARKAAAWAEARQAKEALPLV
jgi:hypothetical protein